MDMLNGLKDICIKIIWHIERVNNLKAQTRSFENL